MYFAVISIFPEMFAAIQHFGITGRAFQEARSTIELINPRDFTTNNYRRIDDRPFGGGPGMVMMAEPLAKAIEYAKNKAGQHGCDISSAHCPVVYLSPQGIRLAESNVKSMGMLDGMILLCGRYEGIDERLLTEYVDIELSIGDYVLTGGELPAMVLIDSIVRRLPGVMNDALSASQDSFVDGLLDCPHYTRPLSFNGLNVPDVLLSGNHAQIAQWRFKEQVKRTKLRRPDLWQSFCPNSQQKKWLDSNS